jgi:hypothetical protein
MYLYAVLRIHHFDADLDPAFRFDADPDPTLYLMRIRILILPFNLMQIRIRIRSYPSLFPDLAPPILQMMRIRIKLPEIMRTHADSDPQHLYEPKSK